LASGGLPPIIGGNGSTAKRHPAGRGGSPRKHRGEGGTDLLRLLLGRAGTGKTETCLREALAALAQAGPDGPPLVLLGPEQATYQLERALLQRLPVGAAVAHLEVLSFRRLARRVLAECGGLARPRLGEVGRRMILRSLLREHRADLRAFGGSVDRPGLAHALAQQLAEFEAYALEPADLRARIATAPSGTAERLADLALLWEAYRARLHATLTDPGADLATAAALLPGSSLAAARVWVDGFAGFTPREERLLTALLATGAEVAVALCLDGREPLALQEDAAHPFAPTRRTWRRLQALAGSVQVTALDGEGPPARFRQGGAIAALEAGLWGPQRPPVPPGPSLVLLAAAADAQAEVEAVADEIDRLCREEGYRHREIAVILRDLEAYHDLLAPAFAARGIPAFIDRKRDAGAHPALATLAAALEVVTTDWQLRSVRRYLHADLCGLRREQADELENFALAHGVSGASWHSAATLSFPPLTAREGALPAEAAGRRRRREARLAGWRVRVVGPVRRLQLALGAGVAADAAAAACFAFLQAVGAPEHVLDWVEQAQTQEEAAWHRQCWQAAVDLLDQLALSLGEAPLTAHDVQAAVQAGTEDLTVGLVPPRLDQVLCGAVERSRHPELRAAFVLGMGDGAFPARPAESPLLGDGDRLALRAGGCELAPTSAERLLSERYLGYIALTRASERLYLSHPAGPGPADLCVAAAAAAGDVAPWPGVAEPTVRRGVPALAGAVALRLGQAKGEPEWEAAAEWLTADPDRARQCAPALAGPQRQPPRGIGADLAGRLYPQTTSATRLEAAAACAFQHFGRYGLRLRRREEAVVDPSHLGELLHAALATFVRGLLEDGLDWAAVDPEEARHRREDALAAAAHYVSARLPAGTGRVLPLLGAVGGDLARAVEALLYQERAGAFRPAAVEQKLQGAGLEVRVDRLDVADGPDGDRYVRVVDYKTGAEAFSLEGFVHGLDLAPVLYLAMAVAASGDLPGGFFLMPVRDQIEDAAGPGAAERPMPRLHGLAPAEATAAALHERALDGRVTGVRWNTAGKPFKNAPVATAAGFALLFAAARRRMGHLRAASAAGAVAPNPYRHGSAIACARCDLLAVCGFDPGAGDRYRWLPHIPDPWTVLRQEEPGE